MAENPIVLRDDQAETVGRLRAALREHQSVLLRGECGWGKTVVAAYMALGVQRRGQRAIFDVHRRELARQTARTFARFGIRFSFIAAGMYYDPFAPIQIASTKTLIKRPSLMRGEFLIPDEAHILGEQRLHLISSMKTQGARIIPLTATPGQGSGGGLGHIADAIVEGPDAAWLMDRGLLAKYRAYAPSSPDLSRVPIRQGEYTTAGVDALMGKPAVVGDAVRDYRRFAFGLRTIAFCYSRKNADDTARAFNDAGIPAAFIDGETPDNDRIKAISQFADGAVKVLINVALFEEGFDLSAQVGRPVPVQAVILGKPTKSLPKAIQMMMRPLRPQEGEAIIIDRANILREHGFPEDMREWSLTEGKVAKSASSLSARVCPACYGTYRAKPACPYCKTPAPVEGRSVKEIEGDLEELRREELNREAERRHQRQQVGMAKTLEEVCAVAIERGYKAGWVVNLFEARKEKRPEFGKVMEVMAKIKRERKTA